MSLRRSTSDKMIGGVCAGIAETIGVDALIVRIGFVLLALFGFSGGLIYLVLWALVPRAEGGSVAEDGITEFRKWSEDRKRGGGAA